MAEECGWAAKGCGCVLAVGIVLVTVTSGISCIKSGLENLQTRREQEARDRSIAKEKVERAAKELAVREEVRRKEFLREEKLRQFALKEAPSLWSTYQDLHAEIDKQNKKIGLLQATLKDFNQNPEQDADYKRICAIRDDGSNSLRTLRIKLEDAYLASRKYEETPGRHDLDELRRKLLEDGIQEAEASLHRFKEMSHTK